ncbi:MAG: SGNH/GDSL hydrolase family protein [Planctomycetes bacterium]|nr:SGNH/GDSL hydrolase family protein [Planctomycetota bacterium]MCB9918725.1 SGNH/GDSL hydrolase family protein [Planctomycetota bacterium]
MSARFPVGSVVAVALGFAMVVLGAHMIAYDPTDELPATSIAPEPHARVRALSPKRAAGEQRVFFIGASMTAGYPYTDGRASYARQMNAGLSAVYGNDDVFVHDYAKPALDSRELVRLVDRVLEDYDPSCVCVTLGSNEFANRIFSGRKLVPSTLLEEIGEHASRARIAYRELPTLRLADEEARQAQLRDRLDDAKNLEPLFGALPVSERDAALLTRRLRHMMQRMSDACRAKDVPLVFVVAVYGLGGFWPWGISGPPVAEIDELVQATWTGFDAVRARAMRARVEALLEEHGGRADVRFLYGTVLRACGELGAAREQFLLARDQDAVPMHQIGMVRDAIQEVAKALGRDCLLLDDAFYSDGAELPDTSEFLDYGHLSEAGARRAATWLARQLAQLGRLPALPAGWEQRFTPAAEQYVRASLPPLELALAMPGIAASNANFSMMFGNFRDALPWLAVSVPGYLLHPELTTRIDQKWRLVQCVYQLSGRYEAARALPDAERDSLLADLDQQINRAVLEDRLWSWIFEQLAKR